VVFRVELSGLVAVVLRVQVVGVGDMRVVRRLFMVPGPVRRGGLTVVLGCVLVVGRRLVVMLDLLFVGHDLIGLRFFRGPRESGTRAKIAPNCRNHAAIG
jgi:hypothetical protein